MHHPVKEPSRHVLQRCRRWPLRHLCPRAMFPFAFQTYLTSAAYQLVRLFPHERRTSAVAEQTYRNLVSALAEQSCRHLIYTWRILIARAAHQAAVHIHRVRVHHASQAQHRLHGAASRRHVYLPAEPVRTIRSPSVACSPPSVEHVHLLPVRIVIVRLIPFRSAVHSRIRTPRLGRPCRLAHTFAPDYGIRHLRVGIYRHQAAILRKVLQRLSAHPCLHGRASPAGVHYPYGYTGTFLQQPAEEITQCRISRHIVLRHRLPARLLQRVGRSVEPVGIRHLQVSHPRVLISLHFFGIAVHHTRHRQLHVRLSGTQKHIAHHHVLQAYVVYAHLIRSARLHTGHHYAPASGGGGRGGIFPSRHAQGYFLARSRRAVHSLLASALQHHAVGKQWRKHHFRFHYSPMRKHDCE